MTKNAELTQKYMQSLELDKVLQMIAQRASCQDSREMAMALMPATTLERVQRRLQETDDAYILMARFGSPSYSGLVNIVNAVRRAEAGGVLNLPELLQIQ